MCTRALNALIHAHIVSSPLTQITLRTLPFFPHTFDLAWFKSNVSRSIIGWRKMMDDIIEFENSR